MTAPSPVLELPHSSRPSARRRWWTCRSQWPRSAAWTARIVADRAGGPVIDSGHPLGPPLVPHAANLDMRPWPTPDPCCDCGPGRRSPWCSGRGYQVTCGPGGADVVVVDRVAGPGGRMLLHLDPDRRRVPPVGSRLPGSPSNCWLRHRLDRAVDALRAGWSWWRSNPRRRPSGDPAAVGQLPGRVLAYWAWCCLGGRGRSAVPDDPRRPHRAVPGSRRPPPSPCWPAPCGPGSPTSSSTTCRPPWTTSGGRRPVEPHLGAAAGPAPHGGPSARGPPVAGDRLAAAGWSGRPDRCTSATFPISPLSPDSHRPARNVTPMRVLVAEDDARMSSMLRRGLVEDGYSVDVATDGQQARVVGDRVRLRRGHLGPDAAMRRRVRGLPPVAGRPAGGRRC